MTGIVDLGVIEAAVPANVEIFSTAGANLSSTYFSRDLNALPTVETNLHNLQDPIGHRTLKAMASISIFAPRGRAATWTVARAGKSVLK